MINQVNQAHAVHQVQQKEVSFVHHADAAQYKESDYANAVRVERGVSLEKAKEIAANDPEIDYFVYTKGLQMVLECDNFPANGDPLHLISGHFGNGYCRTFKHGDVVFFKNEGKWLGSAPGLADIYYKQ